MKKNENYTILIVDDIPKNIQLVASLLTKQGYKIKFAQNGEAAIDIAFSVSPELILLDIMMPGMDGFEVCQKLKENELTKDIPVIFLTAKTDDQTIAKGFNTGGVDYITKPFNSPELLARVHTHLHLRQREIQLLEINAAKDMLLSIIGHDLKTPISNIISLGEIMLSSKDLTEEERWSLFADIMESARVGLNLLENLLAWSRVQLGKISARLEVSSVESVVKSSIKFIQSNADAKNITILTRFNSDLMANFDLNFTLTILRNLLSNAVKFTSENGSIEVSAIENSDYVTISVQDSGVGIPEDRLKILFSQKGSGSTNGTANEKGTGLGLILSNDLAKLQGGKIEVTSEQGQGSNFKLFLKAK